MTEVGSQRSDDGDQRSGLKELGPGVVLLVAELCRGYRCGMGEAGRGKPGIPPSWSVPAFLFLDPFLAGVTA
jgi:hypothetical protein